MSVKFIQTNVLITVLLLSAVAYGADFKIDAPAAWKKVVLDSEDAVYENTRSKFHERVVLQVFKRTNRNDKFQDALPTKKVELAQARERIMRAIGFGDFGILDIEKRGATLVIQSQFRGISGQEVQSLERQYVNAQKLFVVTYLIEAAALNDRRSAETALNYFQPVGVSQKAKSDYYSLLDSIAGPDDTSSRAPASDPPPDTQPNEAAASSSEAAPPASPAPPADEWAAGSRWWDPKAGIMGDPNKHQAMVQDFQKLHDQCVKEKIPADKIVSATDRPYSTVALNSATGCVHGAWDGAKGIVTGTIDLAKAAYEANAAAVKAAPTIAKGVYNWLTSDKYYHDFNDQVRATVGPIASEIKNHPGELLQRARDELGDFMWKSIGIPFMCVNTETRIKAICAIAGGMLPVGTVLKIVMKLPLRPSEMAAAIAKSREIFASLLSRGGKVENKMAEAAKGGEAVVDGTNAAKSAEAVAPAADQGIQDVATAAQPVAKETAGATEAAAPKRTEAPFASTARESAAAEPKPAAAAKETAAPVSKSEMNAYNQRYKKFFPTGVDQETGKLLRKAEAKFTPDGVKKQLEKAYLQCAK